MKNIVWQRLHGNQNGSAIVEFALVLPVFLLIIVGGFYVAILAYSASSMQYAVQAAARCASINTTTCSNTTTTANYAATHFNGTGTPVFIASTAACGNMVSGTLNLDLNAGIRKITVPLSSAACFP